MSKSGWIVAALVVVFAAIAGAVKFWPGDEQAAVAALPEHSHDFIEHGHGEDAEITALKTKLKTMEKENIAFGKLAATQQKINAELQKQLNSFGAQNKAVLDQIELFSVQLAEVQNDDGKLEDDISWIDHKRANHRHCHVVHHPKTEEPIPFEECILQDHRDRPEQDARSPH